jgi:hypothetical protein
MGMMGINVDVRSIAVVVFVVPPPSPRAHAPYDSEEPESHESTRIVGSARQ